MKWYCNFCKRQCSDENGYKVHCSTFSHQAAVERFNRDPTGNRAAASNDFLSGFCGVLQGFSSRLKLKKGKGFSGGVITADEEGIDWVDSNLVYQEYIKDRHHIHLSATRWKSVAGFVRFIGQKGIAQIKKKKTEIIHAANTEDKYIFGVDATVESDSESEFNSNSDSETFEKDPTKRPKWFIKLIDKSPEAILAMKSKEAVAKKLNEEESLQIRQMASVEKQSQTSKVLDKRQQQILPISVEKIIKPQPQPQLNNPQKSKLKIFDEETSSEEEEEKIKTIKLEPKQKINLVLEEIAAEELKFKKTKANSILNSNSNSTSNSIEIPLTEEDDENEIPWIRKGLLIRIGNEQLGNGKYKTLLAIIDEVINDFGAQVTVLKSGDQLLLDQDDCLPVSRVTDEDFDTQLLPSIDQKIISTALKTDRCVILVLGFKGKDGRVLESGRNSFKVEISAPGSSQIHRKQLELLDGQFCIYWE